MTPEQHKDSPDGLSEEITAIGNGIKKLLSAGITRKAVIILLSHDTGLSPQTIEKVLSAATSLSKWTEPRR